MPAVNCPLDELDRQVNAAVLRIRANHNRAQILLGLPITDHTNRDPFEQSTPPLDQED